MGSDQQAPYRQLEVCQDCPGLTRSSLPLPFPTSWPCRFTWQWYILPILSLSAMIPTSCLLFHILQAQGISSGSYEEHLNGNGNSNINPSFGSSMNHGITMAPTLSFSVDSMCVGVILVSIMGLFAVAKGSRQMMRLYFTFVMFFIVVQGFLAIRAFFSGASWVQSALDISWGTAYESNPQLIHDLQNEFRCKGFKDENDRSMEMPEDMDEHLPPCSKTLDMIFGHGLRKLGYVILWIRLVQLAGVLLLSILFRYLAAADQEDEQDGEDPEAPTLMLTPPTDKSGYYLTEKQMEDANARVPLLSIDDLDEDALPQYYIQETYMDEHVDDEESGSEDGDDSEDDGDRTLDGYQNLPDYPEEQEVVSVYVA